MTDPSHFSILLFIARPAAGMAEAAFATSSPKALRGSIPQGQAAMRVLRHQVAVRHTERTSVRC
jgi:hypothetical protein